MGEIIINTSMFGTLEFNAEEGVALCPSVFLEESGTDTDVNVVIEGEVIKTVEDIGFVRFLLESIPRLCRRAREWAADDCGAEPIFGDFYYDVLSESEEDLLLEFFGTDNKEAITPERFYRKLQFDGIVIGADYQGNIIAAMDMCIGGDLHDGLLTFHVNYETELTSCYRRR